MFLFCTIVRKGFFEKGDLKDSVVPEPMRPRNEYSKNHLRILFVVSFDTFNVPQCS